MDSAIEEEQGTLLQLLSERLEEHNENRKAVQEKLHAFCDEVRLRVGEMEERINSELEEKFVKEDDRLQTALNELRMVTGTESGEEISNAFQRAKAELMIKQTYEIRKFEFKTGKEVDFSRLCTLSTDKEILEELLDLKKPSNIKINNLGADGIRFEFVGSACEEKVLAENGFDNLIIHKAQVWKKGEEWLSEHNLKKLGRATFSFAPDVLEANTVYCMKVRTECSGKSSEWSDVLEFKTPGFSECCSWKECPEYVSEDRRYSVSRKNPMIATKSGSSLCTIVGKSPVPLDAITMWIVKILETVENNGYGINIGVAPFDIDQNDNYNCSKCGWYFDCYSSVLWSGPPHNYDCGDKEYGPRKEDGEYVRTGSTVGVIIDSSKGELSFVLDSMDLGVAYSGIPFDKPIVPCVILYYWGDSVELII